MTTLTITAANVVPVAGAHNIVSGQLDVAGETVTAGGSAYKSSTDGKWYKADANDTAAKAECLGVFANSASTNQPVTVVTGRVAYGAILEAGKIYVVSNTAGGIDPVDDLGTSAYTTVVGYGLSTTVMNVQPFASGVQTPSGG